MAKFEGSYTVMLTPFTEDGKKIDVAAARRFIDWQIKEGVPGLIPLGSTGEFLSVADDERPSSSRPSSIRSRATSRSSSAPPPNGRMTRFATAARPSVSAPTASW